MSTPSCSAPRRACAKPRNSRQPATRPGPGSGSGKGPTRGSGTPGPGSGSPDPGAFSFFVRRAMTAA
ncbi:MAG: hypothetical protein E5X67_11475 [Mesorhizobium sp.]|nr:MAG: hypothetical protein E5X67_11475 [Mesorhizobium sp.]